VEKVNEAALEVPAGFDAVIVTVYPVDAVNPVNTIGLESIIGAV
jgi:hypothetical protein